MMAFLPLIVLLANDPVMISAFLGDTVINEKSSIIFKSSISLPSTPDSLLIISNNERPVYPSFLPRATNNLTCPPVSDLPANLFSLVCSVILRYLL